MGLVTTTSNKFPKHLIIHVTSRILYIDCGHVTKDTLSTLLRQVASYKLWFSGLIRTTLEQYHMSYERIGVTTSRQIGVVMGEGKTSYIP